MIWATGQVDIDQNVTPVQHIREKLASSQALFDDLSREGITVHLIMHPDNLAECEDLKSHGFICHAVRGVQDIDRVLLHPAFAAPADIASTDNKPTLPDWYQKWRRYFSRCWRWRQGIADRKSVV